MGRIEQLAEIYGQHIVMPWQQTVAGAQRVIMVVYDKELERTLAARKVVFETATRHAATTGLRSTFPAPSPAGWPRRSIATPISSCPTTST